MDKPPTNFHDWFRRHNNSNFYWYQENILHNILTEESCLGSYKIDDDETILPFRAIPMELNKPWVIVLS